MLGLLAAAEGRARGEDITDLVGLTMGVRVDQAGSLLRDYHTVSDHRGGPLPSTQVNAKGEQKNTSPAKPTYVTQRFYLQDAVFVVALGGPSPLVKGLEHAVRNPAFPLSLGRRSCPPAQPLLLPRTAGAEQGQDMESVLGAVPWQAGRQEQQEHKDNAGDPQTVRLSATVEDERGLFTEDDVPLSFSLGPRTRSGRKVHHTWIIAPTGLSPSTDSRRHASGNHDPFALLGW